MGVPMKLATYALALVVVFIAAAEIGVRLRPEAGAATGSTPAPTTSSQTGNHGGSDEHGHADNPAGDPSDGPTQGPGNGPTGDPTATPTDQPAEPALPGLAATVDGYRLTLLTPRPAAGPTTEVRLLITGPDERPVTAYDIAHGKQLHLIVVRRDLASFQHVHPVLDPTDRRLDHHHRHLAGRHLPGLRRHRPDRARRADARCRPRGGRRLHPGPGRDRQHPDRRGRRLSGRADRSDSAPVEVSTLTATVSQRRSTGDRPRPLPGGVRAPGRATAVRSRLPARASRRSSRRRQHPGRPDHRLRGRRTHPGVYRLFLDFSHDGVVRTAPFVITVES